MFVFPTSGNCELLFVTAVMFSALSLVFRLAYCFPGSVFFLIELSEWWVIRHYSTPGHSRFQVLKRGGKERGDD